MFYVSAFINPSFTTYLESGRKWQMAALSWLTCTVNNFDFHAGNANQTPVLIIQGLLLRILEHPSTRCNKGHLLHFTKLIWAGSTNFHEILTAQHRVWRWSSVPRPEENKHRSPWVRGLTFGHMLLFSTLEYTTRKSEECNPLIIRAHLPVATSWKEEQPPHSANSEAQPPSNVPETCQLWLSAYQDT